MRGYNRRTFQLVELLLIALCVTAVCFASRTLVWEVPFGEFLCYGAALLLLQGLIRDLSIMIVRRKSSEENRRKLLCLCAESSVGLVMVVIGVALLLLGVGGTIHLRGDTLTGLVAVALLAGFIAKDYIILVRRETDHATIHLGR